MMLKCHGKPISDRFAILSRIITFHFLVVYRDRKPGHMINSIFYMTGFSNDLSAMGKLLSRSFQGESRIRANAAQSGRRYSKQLLDAGARDKHET